MLKYKFLNKFKNKMKNYYRIVEDFHGNFFKTYKKKNINIILYKIFYSKKSRIIKNNIFKFFKNQILKIAEELKNLSKKNYINCISIYKIKKLINLFNFFYKTILRLRSCLKKIKQTAFFLNLQKEEKKSLFFSKILPFSPKEPFRKFKDKNVDHSLITYKGRFYNLLQIQLLYNTTPKKLKKNQKKVKNLYQKNKNFLIFLNYKLYIFLYKLNFFHTQRESINYIKKFGILINFKLIKIPNFFIKNNYLLQISEGLFIKFINLIILKTFIANFLINNIIFKILLNINTYTIYILKKNYNYIYLNLKDLFFKQDYDTINVQKKVNTRILLNSIKYFHRR